MLKYIIFITVITLLESCNDSRVQASIFDFLSSKTKSDEELCHCLLNETAEDKFIAEEHAKKKKIEDLENDLQNTKDNMSVVETAKTWMPRKSWNLWTQARHYMDKFFRTFADLTNCFTRDWIKKPALKKALKELKREALFNGLFTTGKKICERAFKHKFFTDFKKWNLVVERSETKKTKKLWVRVQTPHNDIVEEYIAKQKLKAERRIKLSENIVTEEENVPKVDRNKFWRTTKLCMAIEKEPTDAKVPNKPFEVYISAAADYDKDDPDKYIFVFSTTPGKLQNWIDRWFFFWHRVVHVEAYLK